MPVRAVAPRKATPTRARAPQRPEQLFDTHPETSLDFELVRAAARDRYTRPFLLIDSRIIREKRAGSSRRCRACGRTTR